MLRLLPLLLLAGSCSPAVNGSAPMIRFTAIPDENAVALRARFEPVAAYLAHTLGVPIEYVPTSSYSASVEAFRNGDVHLAWFGGLTGVQARELVPGAKVLAVGRVDREYRSYFVAHPDSELVWSKDFPSGLQGKRFTFGSESSTSGRLMPEHFIRQATSQSPEEWFGRPNFFSGSHDKTAKLVEAGTFEAGVLNFRTWERMVEEGRLDPSLCSILWETPTYADYNWTAHPSIRNILGESAVDQVRDALVSLQDPIVLQALNRPEGFVPFTEADFSEIRQLAEDLGFLD